MQKFESALINVSWKWVYVVTRKSQSDE